MSQVYLVKKDGRSEPMERMRCKDEDRELQQLLAHNFDLLPGDQIESDDPRRWLLVKREMPVPDPSTGSDRWSIDFLFVDQDAMPTFVECKRCADTRARREVVGQMLEYAANGHHYWTRDLLIQLAEQTARDRNDMLGAVLNAYGRPTIYSQTSYLSESKRIFDRANCASSSSWRNRHLSYGVLLSFSTSIWSGPKSYGWSDTGAVAVRWGPFQKGSASRYEGRPTRPVWALDGRHVYFTDTTGNEFARCARSPLAPRRRRRSSSPAGSCISRMSRAMAATSSSSR